MAREQADKNGTTTEIPVDIYLLKVNNRNARNIFGVVLVSLLLTLKIFHTLLTLTM